VNVKASVVSYFLAVVIDELEIARRQLVRLQKQARVNGEELHFNSDLAYALVMLSNQILKRSHNIRHLLNEYENPTLEGEGVTDDR
jgi:hypothetical protein